MKRQRRNEGCGYDVICFASHIKFYLFPTVHFNLYVTQINSSADKQLPGESDCFEA
jgi:hypothetical protein